MKSFKNLPYLFSSFFKGLSGDFFGKHFAIFRHISLGFVVTLVTRSSKCH